jgi:hypothetical protein
MSDFTNIDSTTPLLNQQRQQVIRVGGKEVVQHDVAAVEAVGSTFNLKLHIFELPSDFNFRAICVPVSAPPCSNSNRSSCTPSCNWKAI